MEIYLQPLREQPSHYFSTIMNIGHEVAGSCSSTTVLTFCRDIEGTRSCICLKIHDSIRLSKCCGNCTYHKLDLTSKLRFLVVRYGAPCLCFHGIADYLLHLCVYTSIRCLSIGCFLYVYLVYIQHHCVLTYSRGDLNLLCILLLIL